MQCDFFFFFFFFFCNFQTAGCFEKHFGGMFFGQMGGWLLLKTLQCIEKMSLLLIYHITTKIIFTLVCCQFSIQTLIMSF